QKRRARRRVVHKKSKLVVLHPVKPFGSLTGSAALSDKNGVRFQNAVAVMYRPDTSPQLNCEIIGLKVPGITVGHFDVSILAVEIECRPRFALAIRNTARQGSFATINDIIRITVRAPPCDGIRRQ